MIIQCEQCRTKFRLDDSRIKENGVKVRCAKCRHVFTVMKQQPEQTEQSDFGAMLEQSSAFGVTPQDNAPEFPQEQPAPVHMHQRIRRPQVNPQIGRPPAEPLEDTAHPALDV